VNNAAGIRPMGDGDDLMKVEILQNAVGINFAVYEGETRDLDPKIAKDLIRAGIAVPVRNIPKRKAVKAPREQADK